VESEVAEEDSDVVAADVEAERRSKTDRVLPMSLGGWTGWLIGLLAFLKPNKGREMPGPNVPRRASDKNDAMARTPLRDMSKGDTRKKVD
jgi:hypothetical protein